MPPDETTRANHDAIARLLLVVAAAALYFGPPAVNSAMRPVLPKGQFIALAEALSHGELSFEIESGSNLRMTELIPAPAPGRFFCAYPPLPGIILAPFVLLFPGWVTVEAATRAISVVIVVLIDMCLARLPQRLGLPALATRPRVALAAGFAFGTTIWSNADMGMDWHLAHVVSLCAMLLAMLEYAGKRRPVAIGLFIGLSILARPTTLLAGLFFAFEIFRDEKRLQNLVKLSIGPAIAALLLATYNAARFGSPFDFAYDRMILIGQGAELMKDHGQFNLFYVPRNLFWFFAAPPGMLGTGRFPFLGYDPRGMSLFLASPLLLYAGVAIAQIRRHSVVRHAAIAAGLALIPLVTYFNTGYWQFGHRFSMDYLPLLMVLTLVGMRARIGGVGAALIIISMLIHFVAVFFTPVVRLPLGDWVY